MSARYQVLVPFDRSPAVELAGNGRLWRKRLLPVGKVQYKGRTLHFDHEYLQDLAQAFALRAYDQVPFQLAGDDNAHTNDPERYAGEIVDLDLADDGLYAVARVTERGNRVLQENPQLGVSARIVEHYRRSDGRHFTAAIQHVLGTLDPRIPQLGPWQSAEVALASAHGGPRVIDLSGSQFEGESQGTHLPSWAAEIIPPDAAPGEIDALLDAMEEVKAEDEALAAWAEGTDLREALGAGGASRQPGEAELAMLGSIQRSVELANALDELRTIEDAEPLPRLSEDRLSHLLGRVSRGSYTPQQPLGSAPHRLHPGTPGAVTAQPNCGPTDDLGYCQARYHTAHCGSLSTSEMAETVRADLRASAYEPMVDPHGEPYVDQFGQPVTLAGAVEASMGERLTREHVFESHARRELVSIQRHIVHGDPDDPAGDIPAPDATRRTAAALASRLGLAGPDPARDRERARAQRDAVLARMPLRPGHPGYRAETMAERAARVSKTGTGALVKVEDGVSGSLPIFRPAGS